MSSYQDIDIRTTVLEDKLEFVMRAMRMKAVIGNGVLGPDGQPSGRVMDASLLDLYHLSHQHQTELTSDLSNLTKEQVDNGISTNG